MSTRRAKALPALVIPRAPDGASGRVFARHQAEIGHQLASIGEASKVTDFGHDRDRDDESDPAHRLERRGDRRHRPARHQLFDLPRQPRQHGYSPAGLRRKSLPFTSIRSKAQSTAAWSQSRQDTPNRSGSERRWPMTRQFRKEPQARTGLRAWGFSETASGSGE